MKYLIFIVFLLLPNCSGYTVASLSTNVLTVATTGKTNADLVVSYLAGKDCRFIRVTKNSEIPYCQKGAIKEILLQSISYFHQAN